MLHHSVSKLKSIPGLTIKYQKIFFTGDVATPRAGEHTEIFVYTFLNNVVKFHSEPCILSVSNTSCITTFEDKTCKLYFTMSSLDYFQQHIVIKFFQKLGKETLDALCIVYGDDVKPKSSFYKWYKQFADGREECADAPCTSRRATLPLSRKWN